MTYAADLHIHSRYAYATSASLTLDSLARWAGYKGIDLLSSGDFTHPAWLDECRRQLRDDGDGLFTHAGKRFILGGEVECRGRQGPKNRRVHLLAFAPTFDAVERLNAALAPLGNLERNGRPSLPLLPRELLALIKDIDERCFLIPAHLWTPWLGLYGARLGYDSLEECFGDLTPEVFAVETGLSSDPAMNWRVPSLDNVALVSFSDAHSLPNLGRELTMVNGPMTYDALVDSLRRQDIAYTTEFYPEEGKYYYSGHRVCGVSMSAAEVEERGARCPDCGRSVTIGVSHRAQQLGGRAISVAIDDDGLIRSDTGRPPFRRLVPLREILSESLGVGVKAKRVMTLYQRLVDVFGNELAVLAAAPLEDVSRVSDERTARAIGRARAGRARVEPGYDGRYGSASALDERDEARGG